MEFQSTNEARRRSRVMAIDMQPDRRGTSSARRGKARKDTKVLLRADDGGRGAEQALNDRLAKRRPSDGH